MKLINISIIAGVAITLFTGCSYSTEPELKKFDNGKIYYFSTQREMDCMDSGYKIQPNGNYKCGNGDIAKPERIPKNVKNFVGYASGGGYTAKFKIIKNGRVMIYNDSITGTITLVRDKNNPIFRGSYQDGVKINTSTDSNAFAYGYVAYGNSQTSTTSSAKIRDIVIYYSFKKNIIQVSSYKHYSTVMSVVK